MVHPCLEPQVRFYGGGLSVPDSESAGNRGAAAGEADILVTGDKGGRVVLQFSENLDKWTDLQTYTNESGQLWININRGGDVGRLFFRVRAE